MKLKICIIERESIKGVGGSLHKKSYVIVVIQTGANLSFNFSWVLDIQYIYKEKEQSA